MYRLTKSKIPEGVMRFFSSVSAGGRLESGGCPDSVQRVSGASMCVWRVCGVYWGLKRLTTSKIALEGVLRVSEGCLEHIWRVSG